MCPIVPTFTCGFERSNFSFAIESLSVLVVGRLPAAPTSSNRRSRRSGGPPLLGSLDSRDDLFAHVRGRLLVAIEMHRVSGAALRPRAQVRGVAEHLRQRDAGV